MKIFYFLYFKNTSVFFIEKSDTNKDEFVKKEITMHNFKGTVELFKICSQIQVLDIYFLNIYQ